MNGPIILVDVMNLAFRQHFSHQRLTDPDGKPTGVQFGALKTVADLRASVSKSMIFCWDHGVPVPGAPRPRNWRDGMLPKYKATRPRSGEVADAVVPQLAPLHRAISLLGYSQVGVMGLEADDVIGVLSRQWPDREKLIFSTDKDFYQLLDEATVHVLTPKKDGGRFKYVYQSDVERGHGIPVSRWAEYLALGGDGADNIKPVRGMGPKTAIKLIQSGVDLGRRLDEQPAAFRAKYGAAWEDILVSHFAASLPTDRSDPRIVPSVASSRHAFNSFDAGPEQRWPDSAAKARCRGEFASFLADRSMLSLLSVHNSFFEENNQCPQQKQSQKAERRQVKRLL